MALPKPYYRIARPKASIPDYVVDSRYAPDRRQLSRAYINIEKELRNIFNYIEPDENNLKAFSFELYSLLLRACTEVELNCKLIMKANGVTRRDDHFTMNDYKQIEQASQLSKYVAKFNNWRRKNPHSGEIEYISKEFIPFANFAPSISKSPDWYSAYNTVKHNREENLEQANLENCMNAVAGILVLLYSQFGAQCIETYGISGIYWHLDGEYDNVFDADVIFTIHPPKIEDWSEAELYDFNWDTIKTDPEPFDKYRFT